MFVKDRDRKQSICAVSLFCVRVAEHRILSMVLGRI